MLKFDNVTFKYESDDYEMIKDLYFDVKDGEFISLIGASGCGKSTAFRLINGLEKPQSGSITINGTPIKELKNYSSYMPQKDLLYPWRTIEKNVCLPMELRKESKEKMKKAAEEILEEVEMCIRDRHYSAAFGLSAYTVADFTYKYVYYRYTSIFAGS